MTKAEEERIMDKIDRGRFELHLNIILWELQANRGCITRYDAVEKYKEFHRREQKEYRMLRIPLIGRMIYEKKRVTDFNKSTKLYRLMISLMDNYDLPELTTKNVEWVFAHRTEVYREFYEDYYSQKVPVLKLKKEIRL